MYQTCCILRSIQRHSSYYKASNGTMTKKQECERKRLLPIRDIFKCEIYWPFQLITLYSVGNQSIRTIGGTEGQGKTEVLRENPVPVPLCSPEIRHGLTWDRPQASATRSAGWTTETLDQHPRFNWAPPRIISVFSTRSLFWKFQI
jgi:hypothetical protein